MMMDNTNPYFPSGSFGQHEATHDFLAKHYAKHLAALGETPLPPLANNPGTQVFRFTCLRTFSNPFCVVLKVSASGAGDVTRKVSSGKGGYDPGHLVEEACVRANTAEIHEFNSLLFKVGFWNLISPETAIGLDGSHWIIEAVQEGRYHIVDRWAPEAKTPAGIVGRQMLKLAKWKVKDLH